MTDTVEFARTPEEHIELYVQAFNTSDPAVLNRLYSTDAVSVWEGEALTGHERREALGALLAPKPTMNAKVRESYVTADTAMLVVDWTVDTVQDGETQRLSGAGVDVLRRQADGTWRHSIDYPDGTK